MLSFPPVRGPSGAPAQAVVLTHPRIRCRYAARLCYAGVQGAEPAAHRLLEAPGVGGQAAGVHNPARPQ